MKGNHSLAALAATVAIVATSTAQAAVPDGVDAAFTGLLTDATTIAGYAAPVVLGILGLSVALKLVKRFANKV